MTFCTFLTAQFVYPGRFNRDFDTEENDKYKIFVAWKWNNFFFQQALIMEIFLVPYFWILLWPGLKRASWFKSQTDAEILGLCLDHTLPFCVLLIEYVFVSGTPLQIRHFLMNLTLSLLYMLFNIIYVKVTGHAIYATLKWNHWYLYIVIPIVLGLAMTIMFFLLYYLTLAKLRVLGHNDIIDVVYYTKSQKYKLSEGGMLMHKEGI